MKLPIEFLNPAGLWMLTALVPLVVLYILKIKRQRLLVPSTWLWAAAQRDLLARSPFKRLTPQIPLFLQILALIALSLALARPATRGRSIVGDHLAIIIDTSASMTALDASGTSRIELAKRAALSAVDAMAPGSDALVLEAGADAHVAAPLERDRRRLKDTISSIQAAHVEGDLGSAVALAVDRLRQLGGKRRLLVFTDGALANPTALSNVALPIDVVTVGTAIDNAAIVRVDVRSGMDAVLRVEQVQAFALVANYGTRPRDVFVTMRQKGASDVLASRRLLLAPGERAPVVLTFNPTPGDVGQGLLVEISPPDAMPVDDVAYGRVPPGAHIPVVIASAGEPSPWIVRALQSDPFVKLHSTKSMDLAEAGAPADALVVIDGACPPQLPPGVTLIVNPPSGQCLGATVGAVVESPTITSWANADQRFRFLTLDGVHVAKARLVKVDSARQELVHAHEGSLIVDVSAPGRTGTLLSFDVSESNWPLKASFVLFLRNIVELARTHRSHGIGNAGRAGEPVRLAIPHWVERIEVIEPNAAKQDLPARQGLAVVPAVKQTGVYYASWTGPRPGSVTFAINLSSERESDTAPRALEVAGKEATVSSAGKPTQAHTDWTWLLAAIALTVVVVDVWYLTRKPRARSSARLRPTLPERGPA